MQQKMPKQETMTQAHIRKAQGAFLLAHRMGLIEDPSMEGLKARRQKHNEELRRMEQEGQRFYGPHYFSAPAYLQYECTRFRLAFAGERKQVRYDYAPITAREEKAYYRANKDLFTRYMGDKFRFREVKQVVHKKMREEEYDRAVQDLLR